MREIADTEAALISGGNLPLLGALAFVYYERQNIRDFFEGFFDGLDLEN